MWDALLRGLLATSPLEAAAVVLGLVYALLAVRRSRWCWIAGGASAALFTYLAASAALPMQAGLQFFYVVMAVYGWLQWSRADGHSRIGVLPVRSHLIALAAIAVVGLLLARWLATETHAAWPRLDALSTVASLFATWLVARSKLENWLYWIVIDTVLAFLFAAQGLVFTALLFVIYLGIAVAGFGGWLRRYRASQA